MVTPQDFARDSKIRTTTPLFILGVKWLIANDYAALSVHKTRALVTDWRHWTRGISELFDAIHTEIFVYIHTKLFSLSIFPTLRAEHLAFSEQAKAKRLR